MSPEAPSLSLRAEPSSFPLGVTFAAIGLLGLGLVSFLHLDRLGFTVCTFKSLTGLPCMSCGTTRALGRLAAGDWLGALQMNPLATLVFVVGGLWAVADSIAALRGRGVRLRASAPVAHALRIAAVAAIVLNWIYLIAAGR
jgi:Protein of unknown function (DUF2752)